MTSDERAQVTLRIPCDVRYFRSVRLAVGGLATLVGFDIEAIDDLRIAVDEVCGTLAEVGTGEELLIEVVTEPGRSIRIEGSTPRGTAGLDADRHRFATQILSVVADRHGVELDGATARCWLAREVSDWSADEPQP